MGRNLILRLENDPDTENPLEMWDGWKFVNFDRRYNNHQPFEDFFTREYGDRSGRVTSVKPANVGIRRKLDCGTAFTVSCYEHGGIAYSLRGEGYSDQWDTTGYAGILLYTGKSKYLPKEYEDRRKEARCIIETFSKWANGECYWFSIETLTGNHVDSCGGYIGDDDIRTALQEEFFEEGDRFKVEGKAKWLVEYGDWSPAEFVDDFEEEEYDEAEQVDVRAEKNRQEMRAEQFYAKFARKIRKLRPLPT